MRTIDLTAGYGSQWGPAPSAGTGTRRRDPHRAWFPGHDNGPDLDEPLRTDALWDEADDPDFSELMPLRPTLRPHHGVWEDLTDTTGLDIAELAEWVPPPAREIPRDLIEERSARAREIARKISDELEAKRVAAERARRTRVNRMAHVTREDAAEAWNDPTPLSVRVRTRRKAEEAREADRKRKQKRKEARRAQRRPLAAPSAVSRPVRVLPPAPTCTCGHEAAEHNRITCLGSVAEGNVNYRCTCTRFNRREAS